MKQFIKTTAANKILSEALAKTSFRQAAKGKLGRTGLRKV